MATIKVQRMATSIWEGVKMIGVEEEKFSASTSACDFHEMIELEME